eukprot:TRINITY_DN804_c0_g1_i1.p1 TRINITY_DN804_c0_g1~~TRINITY_DN804_c0_g1_i1.p1  ORF type:complete len:475 (+),score=75.85 TRINITY_DN804_c0_g1_i1:103-1527(+)
MEVCRPLYTPLDDELSIAQQYECDIAPFGLEEVQLPDLGLTTNATPSGSSEILFSSPKASRDKELLKHFAQKSEEDDEIEIKQTLYENCSFDSNLLHQYLANSPIKEETLPTSPSNQYNFPETNGKFEIIEKIGEGTFSSVYKAISVKTNEIVALKRINTTCSPERILNEMNHLYELKGKEHIAALLGALRYKDQVTLVLPYCPHEKFKEYMPLMKTNDIRQYLIALFKSLKHLHEHKIIHRDLKPGNFLYHAKTNTYALVDFGLAQKESSLEPNSNSLFSLFSLNPNSEVKDGPVKRKRNEIESVMLTNKRLKFGNSQSGPVLNPIPVSKKSLRAPRGGTRGFRAPEVLMKCFHQTSAIDIWSAGIILLCILSTRYPFFNAPDDLVSLAELSTIFGTREIRNVGLLLNRKIQFPWDPIENPPINLKDLCSKLTSRKEKMPDSVYDLLNRCLDLNPHTRITAKEALLHPFLICG